MEQAKHTPGPWRSVYKVGSHFISDAGGKHVATAHDSESAERIVQCVNAHDELVAALREIAAMTDEDTGTFRKRGGTYRGLVGVAARAALTKAGVRQ